MSIFTLFNEHSLHFFLSLPIFLSLITLLLILLSKSEILRPQGPSPHQTARHLSDVNYDDLRAL